MPNVNGFYQAPTWENDNAPAIDATELQAMCNLLESLDANALTYRSLLTADDNVDTISVTGIYYINSNATPQGTLPTTFSAPARLLHIGTSGIQIQVLFDKNNTVNYRVKSSGNFGAWEYIPDVDTTLTVSGAAADAKTVGDLAIMADKIYNTAEAFDAAFQGDYNNLTPNKIITIGASAVGGENAPYTGFVGKVFTICRKTTSTRPQPGDVQLAISNGRNLYIRYLNPSGWTEWMRFVNDTRLQDNAVTRYSQMILNASQLSTVTGGTLSADDLPANSIVCIGANASGLGGINFPVIDGSQTYTILTVGSNSLPNKGGNAQIAVGANGFASRWRSGSAWGDWLCSTAQAPEYHVGAGQPYTSLTALCQALANDTREKIIYLHPGVYNIYQEYRDAGIPTPPDDVTSGDYLDRCVFLPPNTKLIGIGNVTLQWTPAKAEITRGEARTWSPLNIKYGCHVENIDIVCQYGRYCIHDDSHNAAADQGVSHVFRNVRCFYTYAEDGHGFNNTIGFGFSQKNRYLFDNCTFAFTGAPAGSGTAFYGHGSSSGSEDESPEITVNHCIIIDDAENGRAIRLQNLGSSQLHIKTQFCSCHIDGRVILTDYTSTAKQGFELTLLRSGDHTVEYAGTTNPFPPKIYN